MPDTGWVICGTGSEGGGLGTAWGYTSYITAEDGNVAQCSTGLSGQTNYIIGSNFGFSIPSGTTIQGIEISAKLYSNKTGSYINYARVTHPSSGDGTDLEGGSTAITTSFVTYTYGGPTELHGLSWLYSDINSSSFAVKFALGTPPFVWIECDVIKAKVYYNSPTSSGRGVIIL